MPPSGPSELPLVSTVIPTWNRADVLVVALESALAQTYPAARHEILVVDDGSTDDTAAVVARYGARVRYLQKKNGGVSSARNAGIAAARGELIAFLDSDDVWLPTKLEKQVALFRAQPSLAMVVVDVEAITREGHPISVWRRRADVPHDGFVLRWVLRQPSLVPASALVRASVARAVGGFDESLRTAEDLDFHLKIARIGEIAVLPEVLVRVTRGLVGLSTGASTYEDYLAVVERFLARHADEISAGDARSARFETSLRNARGLIVTGHPRRGVEIALGAVRAARSPSEAMRLGELGVVLARGTASRALRRVLRR